MRGTPRPSLETADCRNLIGRGLLVLSFLVMPIASHAQTQITSVVTGDQSFTPSSYNVNGKTVNHGTPTATDLTLLTFDIGAATYLLEQSFSSIAVRRYDPPTGGPPGTPFGNKLTIWYEGTYSAPTADIVADRIYTEEEALSGMVLNRGSDNTFDNNRGATISNNIERVDFLFSTGLVVGAAALGKSGFPVFERSGGNSFGIAAITAVDGSGTPTSYGPLVIISNNTGNALTAALSTVSFKQEDSETLLEPISQSSPQEVKGVFVSFADLGIASGQAIYGYSLFGEDTPLAADLVDYTGFPKTETGGADLVGGGAFFVEDGAVNDLDIDLWLTHTVDKPSPTVGEQVTFTVTIGNDGPDDASAVQVADFVAPLPAGITLISTTPSVGSFDQVTGLWNLGILANGATATLAVVVQVTAEGDYNSCAEVAHAGQTDVDSTPYNETGEDDYQCVSFSTTGSSGGGFAGLESDGSLARTLAQVLYNRRLAPERRGATPSVLLYATTVAAAAKTAMSVELIKDVIPDKGPENSAAHEVSPADLLPVTNADHIFAVDYLRADDRRLGAVFAAVTPPGTLYEHTKVLCDRLRGASLEGVRNVELLGHRFPLARLRHDDGSYDHAISFVVYQRDDGFEIDSRFRLDEYEPPADGGQVFNVQLWSVSTAYTLALAEQILARLAARSPLRFHNTAADPPRLPKVYVRKGSYEQGRMTLEVFNAARARFLHLTGGALARSESTGHEPFEMTLSLPRNDEGQRVVTVDVPVGPVFDATFFVESDVESGRDQLYVADGAWSYTYDDEGARIERFEVQPLADAKAPEDGKRRLERNVRVEGEVRTWAALFRNLRPGGEPIDLSDYQYIEFTAHGQAQVRLNLEKASLADEHFSAVFKLTRHPQRHRIWFDDLRREDWMGGFTAEDLVALSFYVIGEQGRARSFELNVADITFGGAVGDILAVVPDAFELMSNYPNPFNSATNIVFGLPEQRRARLAIYDIMGRRVAVLADRVFEAGRHEVPFRARGLASGLYLYQLELDDRVLSRTMILSK